MHGLIACGKSLSNLTEKVSGRHLLLDARNHGSSFHHPDCSYDAQAYDLIKFLDFKQIEKAALIGHCMGGRTALTTAIKWPERVEKLVILDVAPIAYRKFSTVVGVNPKRFVRIMQLQLMQNTSLYHKTKDQVLSELAQSLPAIVAHHLVKTNLVDTDKGLKWTLAIDYLLNGFEEIFAEQKPDKVYEGPSMLVAGGSSNHTTLLPEEAGKLDEMYSSYLKNLKIVTIPEAGHVLPIEKPRETARLIKSFLED